MVGCITTAMPTLIRAITLFIPLDKLFTRLKTTKGY